VRLEQVGGLDVYLFSNDLKPFFQLLWNVNIEKLVIGAVL
jgi:hypothetical protein